MTSEQPDPSTDDPTGKLSADDAEAQRQAEQDLVQSKLEGDQGDQGDGAGAQADPPAPATFEDSDHGGSPLGEHIMQRLRYFENLVEHQHKHIKSLGGILTRHGIGTPDVPNFPVLKSPLGDFNPNDRT